MWARAPHLRCVGWALLLGLACASVAPSAASEYLRAEWQVGQEQISAHDLELIAPPPAPEELTLQDALALALRHNLGFRRTVQRLLSAQSTWQVAKQRWSLELFGRVERAGNGDTVEGRQAGIGLSYSAITGADFSVVTELDRLNSEQEQTLTASLRQPLLAGRGAASAAYEELRRARNAYRAALLSFFVEQEDLIERVISSYLAAIQQQQLRSDALRDLLRDWLGEQNRPRFQQALAQHARLSLLLATLRGGQLRFAVPHRSCLCL